MCICWGHSCYLYKIIKLCKVGKYVTWSTPIVKLLFNIGDVQVTAICIEAQNANIFLRFLCLKRGVYRWKQKYIHRSCDVSHAVQSLQLFLVQLSCFDVPLCMFQYFQAHNIVKATKLVYSRTFVTRTYYHRLGNIETCTKVPYIKSWQLRQK